MKWRGKRQSSNVDDRRGQSSSGGGLSPMLLAPLIKLLFSKVGLIIVGLVLVFSFITGNNPLTFIGSFFPEFHKSLFCLLKLLCFQMYGVFALLSNILKKDCLQSRKNFLVLFLK